MKVAVMGLGKMGASLCADLKAAGAAVTGSDTDPRAVEHCVSENLIDRGFASPADIPTDVEIYVLAVPVGVMGEVARELFSRPRHGAVVTDIGSVKEPVIRNLEKVLPPDAFFVPAHPIAGDERHGAQNAGRGIFEGKPVIITPGIAGGDTGAVSAVCSMWEKTGAHIVRMPAVEHDRIFAFLSHLPHACAYALATVAAVAAGGKPDAGKPDAGKPGAGKPAAEAFSLSGGGLADTTRIALSDPEMWAGILVENSAHVLPALERFGETVAEITEAVRAGDRGRLAETLERGRAAKTLFNKNRPESSGRL